MAEAHLDHPDDVTWFAGYGPRPILGDCPHDCPHDRTNTVAWGPDFDHYTLAECRVPDGCNGRCRGWTVEYPHPFTAGPKFRQKPFKLTAASALGVTA